MVKFKQETSENSGSKPVLWTREEWEEWEEWDQKVEMTVIKVFIFCF